MNRILRRYWREILLSAAVVAFGSSAARAFLAPGRPSVNIDAALFQHAGWYVTQGAVPYVDIWDIKPPLLIELTTVLAVFSGGNMYILHVLSVFVTASAGIGSIYLIGTLVYELTDDELAGLVAGGTMLSLAGFHWLAATGIRPKYFSVFFGVAGIVFQLRGRSLYSGGAAALSAGFMQHAIVFAVLVLGLAVQSRSRRQVRDVVVGMGVVTMIAVLPIVLLGATEAMLVEVVVIPLQTSQSVGAVEVLRRLAKGLFIVGYAAIPVLIGSYGAVRYSLENRTQWGWITTGTVAYALQVLFVDFDGYPDLFFGLVFVAIGVGLIVNATGKRRATLVSAVVAVVVVISVVSFGGAGVVSTPVQDEPGGTLIYGSVQTVDRLLGIDDPEPSGNITAQQLEAMAYGSSEMERIYWTKVRPESCHYRLSGNEVQWIERTNASFDDKKCGQSPDLV